VSDNEQSLPVHQRRSSRAHIHFESTILRPSCFRIDLIPLGHGELRWWAHHLRVDALPRVSIKLSSSETLSGLFLYVWPVSSQDLHVLFMMSLWRGAREMSDDLARLS
jgi:hypothetical protein